MKRVKASHVLIRHLEAEVRQEAASLALWV
jgi:hypothetical protein